MFPVIFSSMNLLKSSAIIVLCKLRKIAQRFFICIIYIVENGRFIGKAVKAVDRQRGFERLFPVHQFLIKSLADRGTDFFHFIDRAEIVPINTVFTGEADFMIFVGTDQ